MLKLLDGPVAGVFLVNRAPMFLRAVIDDRTNEKDVLDQIDDEPKSTESLFVYEIQGAAGWVHLLMSPRSKSGFFAAGEYKHIDEIDGEPIDTKAIRNNDTWRAWVMARTKARGLVVNPINGAIQGPAQ